jgi:hypothetical protein
MSKSEPPLGRIEKTVDHAEVIFPSICGALAFQGAPSFTVQFIAHGTTVRGDCKRGVGKVDLVTANYDGDTLTVLTNNGSGGFAISATLAGGASPFNVTAADVNLTQC